MGFHDLFDTARCATEPGIPDDAVRAAARIAAGEKFGSEAQRVRRVVELAGVIAQELSEPTAEPITGLEFTATARIVSTVVLDQLRPDVEAIRVSLWGHGNPLFGPGEWERAREWLLGVMAKADRRALSGTRVSKEELARISAEEERLEGIRQDADDLVTEMGYILGDPLAIDYEITERIRCDERLVIELHRYDHPLAPLVRFGPAVAAYAGVSEPAAVQYIVCGKTPHVPRATVLLRRVNKITSNADVKRRRDELSWREQLVLTLNTPDLTLDELRTIYQGIQQAWAEAGVRESRESYTEDDVRLREIIAKLGGLDRDKQPRGFWPAVVKEWETQTGERPTVGNLKTRWSRFLRKQDILPLSDSTPASDGPGPAE